MARLLKRVTGCVAADVAPVVGVVGGSGGVGASTFAAVLAVVAGSGVLVDLDVVGGGVDVLLGIEHEPGARWSGVRVDGGHLDPDDLASGLPRWGGAAVLALDADPPPAAAVRQVLAAATSLGTVVVDLGRADSPARRSALRCVDLVVVLAAGGVRELAAARAVIGGLGDVSSGVVLRRGDVREDAVPAVLGVPLVGVVPPLGVGREPRPTRLPPALARVAAGVLDGVGLCRI